MGFFIFFFMGLGCEIAMGEVQYSDLLSALLNLAAMTCANGSLLHVIHSQNHAQAKKLYLLLGRS